MTGDGRRTLTIADRKEGAVAILSATGRLDGVGAPVLHAWFSAAAKRGDSRMVLDCSELAYISSVGLRALLVGAKTCAQQGGWLSIAALRPACRSVMDASGLLSVVDYHETVEAALSAAPSDYREQADAGRQGSGLEIEERREGPATVLSLNGRLDGSGAPQLMARISAIAGRGGIRMVLDCERMSYVDSSGLRALLIGARACQQRGGKLVVAALLPECRSVIGMSGFLSVIACHETREAALAALA